MDFRVLPGPPDLEENQVILSPPGTCLIADPTFDLSHDEGLCDLIDDVLIRRFGESLQAAIGLAQG